MRAPLCLCLLSTEDPFAVQSSDKVNSSPPLNSEVCWHYRQPAKYGAACRHSVPFEISNREATQPYLVGVFLKATSARGHDLEIR